MRDPDEFDAFYQAARGRLLLQTYALTGDLPAARSSVRDAFIAAWHHWPKVARHADPETWVRPVAWQHALRRRTARIWHRDRTLDPATADTLAALGSLSTIPRKALLLTFLAGCDLPAMAREIGLTDEAAGSALRAATSAFAAHRDVPSTEVQSHLEALQTRLADTRLPRPTIIRRAGATRRRTHTGLGMAAAVAALVVSGMVVERPDGDARADAPIPGQPAATTVDGLDPRELLGSNAITGLSPQRTVHRVRTDDNTEGDGLNTLCQRDRFADPDGIATLVRRFRLTGEPGMTAVQSVELSASQDAARTAYDRVVGWYAECRDLRVQLVSVHALEGIGDQGHLLVLQRWGEDPATLTVAVARTGRLLTSAVRRTSDLRAPQLAPMTQLTASAIRRLCDHDGAGACPDQPRATPSGPPPAEEVPGLLQVVDIPPASGLSLPWVGTKPRVPRVNPAASRCDGASFRGKAVLHATARSFLVPQAELPASFGLSETVGRFRSEQAARSFVQALRARLAACEDSDLATTLTRVHDHRTKDSETGIWRLATEISDQEEVSFHMALVRRGDLVAQLGFVPVKGTALPDGAFHALADRAAWRLGHLPRN